MGHEFDPIIVLISSQLDDVRLEHAQYQLMLHEQQISHLNSLISKVGLLSNSHLIELNSIQYRDGGWSGGRYGGRNFKWIGHGRNRGQFSVRLHCQICLKSRH